MKKVYIRADANEEIASGHIMRCLSIAKQLNRMGAEAIFIISDDEPTELIKTWGVDTIVLHSDWRNKEAELPELRSLIDELDIKVLLVDSYQATPVYLEQLNHLVNVVYLDDMHECLYKIRGLISYCLPDSAEILKERYSRCDWKIPELWLGLQYTPLREEFMNCKEKTIGESVRDVMITTGGSDMHHISGLIARTLVPKYNEIMFHLVIGRFYDNVSELHEYSEDYSNLVLYENYTDMADLMQKCDLAISAGGTTLNELCACGTPTICFSMAENQVEEVIGMKNAGAVQSLGNYSDYLSYAEYASALDNAFQQMQHALIRKQYSSNMKQLIDGKGAVRIAEALLELV